MGQILTEGGAYFLYGKDVSTKSLWDSCLKFSIMASHCGQMSKKLFLALNPNLILVSAPLET